MSHYTEFTERFKLFISKHPKFIENTLSNIFSMRIIGNKTHGDLAEVGISEFISQFMYDYSCQHVGKDAYRAKEREEDILITDEIKKIQIPVSLKAYGDGPLQLSTDKSATMFETLRGFGKKIDQPESISMILEHEAFSVLESTHVLPLIYRECSNECNILVFRFHHMKKDLDQILFIDKNQRYNNGVIVEARGRKHPLYLFLNKKGEYICEVRYGGKTANALQRGMWTNTKFALNYFDSLTNGWISFKHNYQLVELIKLALNTTESAHMGVNDILRIEIEKLKRIW